MSAETPDRPAGFEHVFEAGESEATLLLLHGTGGDQYDLLPLGRGLAPGCSLLSPLGRILENGVSRRFFRRHAVGKLDIPDLLSQTDDLAAFVSESADAYGFNPELVVTIGLSNGANIAVSLLFRHPELLFGAALLRPMLPYEPGASLDLAGTRAFIAAGGRDHYVPAEQSRGLERCLSEAGATVDFHFDETAGHGMGRADITALTAWLAAVV